MDKKKEYIICSAIYIDDKIKRNTEDQPNNIESGFVVSGRRHNNCYSTLQIIDVDDKYFNIHLEMLEDDNKKRMCHGFITSDNRYLPRREALEVAIEANQIEECMILALNPDNPILISEMLY